jgi:hypothetical protein
MGPGKSPLHFPFDIAIEERTAEPRDEQRDGEDGRTQAKAHGQRKPAAGARRSWVDEVFQ